MNRIRANFVAPLLTYDGLQLCILSYNKSRLVALAIGDDRFVATTVTPHNLNKYFDGVVDLRYLFTYPSKRNIYVGSIVNAGAKIEMEAADPKVPEDWLPEAGFFSRSHNHDFDLFKYPTGVEVLGLDGHWELQDFGLFQQKYADIYAFAASLGNYNLLVAQGAEVEGAAGHGDLEGLKRAFWNKPLRGGGSYGGLFSSLNALVPRKSKLRLDKIKKESPGKMEVKGDNALLDQVSAHVENYLESRVSIDSLYNSLYNYLKSEKLLRRPVADFQADDVRSQRLFWMAMNLAASHGIGEQYEAIRELCQRNALATAKVTLAFHRRVEAASEYFAQGRVAFDLTAP